MTDGNWGDIVEEGVKRHGSLVVGIDPVYEDMPDDFRSGGREPVQCLQDYSAFIIDTVAPHVSFIKPQAAFFEAFGSAGVDALARVMTYARQKGLRIILDAKRGPGFVGGQRVFRARQVGAHRVHRARVAIGGDVGEAAVPGLAKPAGLGGQAGAVALDRLDDRLDGLLSELLGAFLGAFGQKLRGPARRRVGAAAGVDGGGKAGQRVGMFYGSANYDEDVFDDPYTFNILRDPNPHVGFGGTGAHYCIGTSLARMTIDLMFNAIADAMPDITSLAQPERLRSGWLNGIKHWQVDYVGASKQAVHQ